MAKTNQTFKAVLKLQSSQFKKEIKSVQASMNNLKKSFLSFAGALGAGLGLAQLISNMRKTATEMSVAKATLENVSRVTKEYSDGVNTASVSVSNFGENMEYVRGLADKYKQDLITLTDSFAKFSAAANTANVGIDEQRMVFEELTKAATFFHMSADRTQQMLVAVEQMFSKGKVTSEELRRQLGNNLPGAFGIMARAIGVTNAELDKMLKNGEVLAADALPKFAKELSKITTGNIKLDSLQLAQNEVKNAFTNLVEEMHIEKTYKKILDLTTKLLNILTKNWRLLGNIIQGIIVGWGSKQIWGGITKASENWVKTAKNQLKSLKQEQTKILQEMSAYEQKYPNMLQVKNKNGVATPIYKETATSFVPAIDKQKIDEYEKKSIANNKKILELEKQINKERKVGNTLLNAGKNILLNFKAILSSLGIYAIISLIASGVSYLISANKELKEIKKLAGDMKHDFSDIVEAAGQEWFFDELYANLEKTKQGTEEWTALIAQANDFMKLTGEKALGIADTMETIKEKCEDWVTLQRILASDSAAQQGLIDTQARLRAINRSLKDAKGQRRKALIEEKNQYEEMEKYYKSTLKGTTDALRKRNFSQVTGTTATTGTGGTNVYESLSKSVEKAKQSLKELENQYKAGALTEKEYNDELADLIDKTFKAITAFDNFEKGLKSLGASGWFEDIARQFALLKLSIDEEADALAYDAEMAEKAAEAYEKFKEQQGEGKYQYANIPNRGVRDTTFDYKKTQSGILGEELDLTKEQIDYLTDAIEKAREKAKEGMTDAAIDLAYLTNELKGLQSELTNLQDKMVMAELQEDIAKYQEKLFSTTASGIKNMATSLDRLVSSTKSLMETLQDPDATAWEQIMGVFNQMVQVFDTIIGFVELFNTMSEISNTLGLAKNALEQRQVAIKEQGIATTELAMATEKAQATQAVANLAALTAAEIIAKKAAIGSAVGGAVNSAMQLPYPANLAALASNMEALATALAAGEALQAFAKGGIVGGNSTTGDRNLVRVNSGELILNKAQQGNLFSLLNGKGSLGAGQVQFKIRGSDLVGTLNNYNSKIRG